MSQTGKLREFAAPLTHEEYFRALISGNQKPVTDAKPARNLAEEAKDLETQDLMVERITLHEKTIWMLSSFLKG